MIALSCLLLYDPATGVLTHNPDRPSSTFKTDGGYHIWQTRFSRNVAGHLNAAGYWQIDLLVGSKRLRLLAHRACYALGHSSGLPSSKIQIDHINGNRIDNRLQNLRLSSNRENSLNSAKSVGASGYRGVKETTSGRFAASICNHGKGFYLGTFDTPEEAHAAYRQAAIGTGRTDRHICGLGGVPT